MISTLLLTLATLGSQAQGNGLDRIRALHASGEVVRARWMAEAAHDRDRSDYEATMLLADIHYQRPVIGRYEALRLYRHAANLEPDSLEPLYGVINVGRYLASDEGETIARNAIYKIWAVDPDYRDTWDLWQQFFIGESQYGRAIEILSRYVNRLDVRLRIASMFLDLNRFVEADSVARQIQADGHRDASLWAIRAEAAFANQDIKTGTSLLFTAIDSSAYDTTDYLFRQVATVANTTEVEEYAETRPGDRPSFWQAFWESREPDLTTPENERIYEHFSRLRKARHDFRLRHPYGRLAHDFAGESEFRVGTGASGWDIMTDDSLSRYRRLGMDGRGVTFMRYGEPRIRWKDGDREGWNYDIDGVNAWITLAIDQGDYLLRPIDIPFHRFEVGPTPGNPVFHDYDEIVETDRSSIVPDLELQFWAAQFRGDAGATSVFVRTDPEGVHARIWDAYWVVEDSTTGAGVIELESSGGSSHIGIDFRNDDNFGSVRGDLLVHAFPEGRLKLSSLLVVPGAHPDLDRNSALSLMPVDLEFSTDSAITLFTEIYFLRAHPDGRFKYDLEYRFVPVGESDEDAIVTFEYNRDRQALPTTLESVVIDPRRIRNGEYDIIIRVTDRVTGSVTLVSRVAVGLN